MKVVLRLEEMALWLIICHASMRTHFRSTEQEKKNREGRGGKGCGEQRRLRREGRSAEGGEGERDGGRRERRVSDYRT